MRKRRQIGEKMQEDKGKMRERKIMMIKMMIMTMTTPMMRRVRKREMSLELVDLTVRFNLMGDSSLCVARAK